MTRLRRGKAVAIGNVKLLRFKVGSAEGEACGGENGRELACEFSKNYFIVCQIPAGSL